MSTLRFPAGVGVGFSGACGLSLVWRARKPLPCALRSSAALALGHERRATVPQHHLPVLGLSLRPYWMQPSLLFSVSFFLLQSIVPPNMSGHIPLTNQRTLRFHAFSLLRSRGALPRRPIALAFTRTHTCPARSSRHPSNQLMRAWGPFCPNTAPALFAFQRCRSKPPVGLAFHLFYRFNHSNNTKALACRDHSAVECPHDLCIRKLLTAQITATKASLTHEAGK